MRRGGLTPSPRPHCAGAGPSPTPIPPAPPRRAPRDALRGGPAPGVGRVSASGRGGVGRHCADWKPLWGGCAVSRRQEGKEGAEEAGLGVAGWELASPERGRWYLGMERPGHNEP